MLETPQELDGLQQILDRSAAGAGPHLRDIITDDRRLSAAQLSEKLQGMRLLVVATVTADGRPLAGPVDGYLLHGSFYFSSGRNSVRMRHLAARPAFSATYLPGEELAVTVHGRASCSTSTIRPAVSCARPCSTTTSRCRVPHSRPGWIKPTLWERASLRTRSSPSA
jgi:Pyridoxamine 5'-phosphate oxidase